MLELERNDQIRELIRAAHVLDRAGLCPATDGNFSARAGRGTVLLTRSGIAKRDLSEASFVELSLTDLNPGEGSSEWGLHRAIYAARAEIVCILHVHAPFLTSFAAARKVPPISLLAEARVAVGEIALVPYCTPGTRALGVQTVASSATAMVYLLANHGAVSLGTSVQDALYRLERAEFLARVAWQSLALGGGLPLTPMQLEATQTGSSGDPSPC